MTELMLVVAIAGILASIAIPSFSYLTASQRVKNASFEVYALLNIARSESIKRNADVTITPIMVGGVFDRIEVTAANGTMLYTKSAPKAVGIKASIAGITYQRTGRTTTPGATFWIDIHDSGTGGVPTSPSTHAHCITLSLSGMPNAKKGGC